MSIFKNQIITFAFIKYFIFLLKLNYAQGECPRESPIFNNDSCTLRYCTDEEYITNVCKINNEIIKTQWITNNIIMKPNYRYVNLAKFSNGDLILELSENPYSSKRFFFGLKQNGRYLFKNESAFYSMSVNEKYNKQRYYGEIFIINIMEENVEKEYLVSIGRGGSYVEVYDFDLNKSYIKETTKIFNGRTINSVRENALKIFSNNQTYILLCALAKSTNIYFTLHKLNFSSIDINEIGPSLESYDSEEGNAKGEITSCFETKLNIIICLYNCFIGKTYGHCLLAFNYDLEKLNTYYIQGTTKGKGNFYSKCIHYKDEIGVFNYYNEKPNSAYVFPYFDFISYNNSNSTFEPYMDTIILDKVTFNNDTQLNDILKISENKLCFISVSLEKENLYIIILNIIEQNNIITRYYSLDLLLYNLKVYVDLTSILYNKLISMSFSCFFNDKESKKYSGFILLGYPNSTDETFEIEKYLIMNNNITINNIIFDLNKNVKIENNLFGYIYYGIQIAEINDCDDIKLISTTKKNKLIETNYLLEKNEKIKISFINKEYNKLNCSLYYSFIVTEPNLEEYNKYPFLIEPKNHTEEKEIFDSKKELYKGRTSIYNIIIENDLVTNCNDSNCLLCSNDTYDTNETCITCMYNYYLIEDNNHIAKNCLDKKYSKNLEEIIYELDEFIQYIDFGQSYIINGDGYSLIIKPIEDEYDRTTVKINFNECLRVLKYNFNISSQLTLLQLNIENNNDKCLFDQVEYKIYNESRDSIDLSVCNGDINLQIEYEIKNKELFDLEKILKFQEKGINILDINDAFFRDICFPYFDESTDSDMILADRISDIFINVSLCEKGCKYRSFDLDKMKANCDCKVKFEINHNFDGGDLVLPIKTAFLDSNFGVVKCYKLVFSLKGKIENFGFWLFLLILLIHIPLYIFYFKSGINPIKIYISNEMKIHDYEVKNLKRDTISIYSTKKLQINNNNNININDTPDRISINKDSPKSRRKSNFVNNKSKFSNNPSSMEKFVNLKRNSLISSGHYIVSKPTKIEDFNSNNENPDLNHGHKDNKFLKNIEYPLIHISAKNDENYKPFKSNQILNNFDFTEAIEYEDRKFFRIFYIYLIKKEKLLNIIFLKPPLELLPLRAILFLFNYSCSIFLNSFFYFSDKISFKYRYHGKYKTLLVLINNLTVSLSSTIISLILIIFFKFLTHSSRKIEKLFLDEEKMLRSDKKYKVKRKKKLLIKYTIQKILKSLEIKIVIFIVVEFLFILFFFYYVTAFCHVYKKTQVDWLLNSFSSFVISSLIAVSLSFLLSIIYKISTKNKYKFLYCISIFFYN